MNNKYFFLHVPKTAGTSLFKVFTDILGKENVKAIESLTSVTNDIEKINKFQFIGGHFAYSDYLKYIGKDRNTLTFLRNPVERFISQYYYLRNNVDDYKFGYVQNARKLDLKSYAEYYSNKHRCGDVLNRQLWHFIEYESNMLNDNELLEIGKKNLAKMDFVGICEEMTESIDMMCYNFNWPLVNEIPMVNVTNKKPIYEEIDCSTLELIKELNDLDIQLYEYGLKLFKEKKREILKEAVKVNYNIFQSKLQEVSSLKGNVNIDLSGNNEISNVESEVNSGSGEMEIIRALVYNNDNGNRIITVGREAFVEISFKSHIDAENVIVGFEIENDFGQKIYGTNNLLLNQKISVKKDETYCILYNLNMNVTDGKYRLNVALHSDECYNLASQLESAFHKFLDLHSNKCYYFCKNIYEFRVEGIAGIYFDGLVNLEIKILSGKMKLMNKLDEIIGGKLSLKIKEIPKEVQSETLFFCVVDIMNCSDRIIDSYGDNPVHISYHWIDEKDNIVVYDGERTNITPPLLPFNHREYKLGVISPKKRGKYRLVVTLVQEGVAWLEQLNKALPDSMIIEVKRLAQSFKVKSIFK